MKLNFIKNNRILFGLFSVSIITVAFYFTENVFAAPWGTEGVPGQSSGGSVCDHHDSSGSCLFPVPAPDPLDQVWKGGFEADLQGTAGWFGKGITRVEGCLSFNSSMFSSGSSCVLLYKNDLENSFVHWSNSHPGLSANDYQTIYKYWVVNIYQDEAYAYNINLPISGRHVKIKSFNVSPLTVNAGEQIRVAWDTEYGIFEEGPEISWSGAIKLPGSLSGQPTGERFVDAGTTAGMATIVLDKVCGPISPQATCLPRQEIEINVVAPPPPVELVNLNFSVKDVCTNNAVVGASVNIDHNFGNGTSRTTDGNGFANFGVEKNTSIGWVVSANSYNTAAGNINSGNSDKTVDVTLNRDCGGPPPPPSTPPQLICAASPEFVKINESTTLSATGGTGAYAWTGGENPPSGNNQIFTTQWSTTGDKPVAVTSGTQSQTCNVRVSDNPPQPPEAPQCTVSKVLIKIDETTTLTGSKGDLENYTWYEGAKVLGIGESMPIKWTTEGTKNVTVSSGGKTGDCPPITVQVVSGGPSPTVGNLDRADCDIIGGWTLDTGHKNDSITAVLSWGGGGWIDNTDVFRGDVNSAYNATGNHGFNILTPSSLKDGKTYIVNAYGVDADTGNQVSIGSGSVTCGSPSPGFGSGTVVINSNNSTAANYLVGPAPCNTGLGCGWNGSKTWFERALGSYSINADPVSGQTVTVTSSDSTLNNNGETITFDIVYSAGASPSPPPPEQEKAGAECRVTVSGYIPAVSNVTVSEPNYCVSGPGGTVSWLYSEPSGSPQSAYQVQVDDQGSFGSPEVDSGQVNSNSRSYSIPQGELSFDVTYRARVRAWNSAGAVSSWSMSASWKTPKHAYPNNNGSFQFTWSPANPSVNAPIQFTDKTWFDPSSNGKEWLWIFTPGTTRTQQNPTYTFTSNGSYQVLENIRDDSMPNGQFCAGPVQTINIQKPIPKWKEVPPK